VRQIRAGVDLDQLEVHHPSLLQLLHEKTEQFTYIDEDGVPMTRARTVTDCSDSLKIPERNKMKVRRAPVCKTYRYIEEHKNFDQILRNFPKINSCSLLERYIADLKR
jgi:hypothetical protein